MSRKFSTMADCQLYNMVANGKQLIMISDNGGDSGIAYRPESRIGYPSKDYPPYGYYNEGEFTRFGREMAEEGTVVVDPTPIPNTALDGFTVLQANKAAIYRFFSEDN